MVKVYKEKTGLFHGMSSIAIFVVVFSAVLYWLGFANPWKQLPFAAFFLPAILYIISFHVTSYKRALFFGWLSQTLGASLALYWVSVPMHDFAGAPWVAGFGAAVLLGAYLGVYGALFTAGTRFFRLHTPPFLAFAASALLWGALEWLKGMLFTGFPWLTLSASLAPWPVLVQGASIVGAYGLSSLYLAAAFALVEVAGSTLRFQGKRRYATMGMFLALAVLLPVCLAMYAAQPQRDELPPAWRVVRIGLVQGNMSQGVKWEPTWQSTTVRQYLRLSRASVGQIERAAAGVKRNSITRSESQIDLLIWPETSVPFYFQNENHLTALIRDFVWAEHVPVIIGTLAYEVRDGGRLYYNRMTLVDKLGYDGGFYDKKHLVPFGEYLPLQLDIPFAKDFLQGFYFTPGKGKPVLEVLDFYRGNISTYKEAQLLPLEEVSLILGPLICYEAIFPYLAQDAVEQGANLLVNISNDAWFGHSPAAAQHLQLAAMRAVEQGRYLVRATNTGISAIISPRGEVLQYTELFKGTQLSGTVYTINEKTLFHQWYGRIIAILLIGPAIAVLWGLVSQLRQKGQNQAGTPGWAKGIL